MVDAGIEDRAGQQGVFVTTIEELYNWRRKRYFPMQFGLACCAIEMIATTMARYDLAGVRRRISGPSPRQKQTL